MFEQLYNAIFVGSIYALFAVGFALVFSVLDILNLAHPVVFMLGAIAATFFMSSGLGGVAGALLGFAYNAIYPQMGTPYELKAFTVMVVGGMGSLPGAVLGAYILGIGEIAALVRSEEHTSELQDALAFGLL